LSRLVGASRERVTLALAQLRRAGLVGMTHRQRGVRVLHAAALQRYGESV
jgi:hypothetical protein